MAAKTGSKGKFTLAASTVKITKWTLNYQSQTTSSTDSSNYDAGTGRLWSSQAHGEIGGTGTIEGYFDSATHTTALINQVKLGTTVAAVFYDDQSNAVFTSSIDLGSVEIGVTVPGAEMVSYSAAFMTSGVVS